MSDDKDRVETAAKETKTDDAAAKSPEMVTTQVDLDAEKRQGVKDAVANSEAIAVEKSKADVPSGEKAVRPSFFVKKTDRHRIEVDILSGKRDGRIMSVSRTGLGLNFEKDFTYLIHEVAWFEFSLPNYEDMSTYRQRSSVWRREAQQSVVDRLQLRNFMLVWHLKDWSLADEEGNKVKLEYEETGALTDECVARVYAVNPTLIDVVLTLLEKDVLLS